MLAEIVDHQRGKGLVAMEREGSPGAVDIFIPLPVLGPGTPAMAMIPRELHYRFADLAGEIVSARFQLYGRRILEQFIGQQMTPKVVTRMNVRLLDIEQDCEARGDEPLWQTAAMKFGIWPALPKRLRDLQPGP